MTVSTSSVKLFLVGITGRVGNAILQHEKQVEGVEIVAGVSRNDYVDTRLGASNIGTELKWYRYGQLAQEADALRDVDVFIDFSDTSVFDEVLDLAVELRKPLICGTGNLLLTQEARLYDMARMIPIFRGGYFEIGMKKFIDQVVEFAKTATEDLTLVETLCHGQISPSGAAEALRRSVIKDAGKELNIVSRTWQSGLNQVQQWQVVDSPLCYRISNFSDLAKDVLKIAKVLVDMPAKNEFYALDDLYDEVVAL